MTGVQFLAFAIVEKTRMRLVKLMLNFIQIEIWFDANLFSLHHFYYDRIFDIFGNI